jgi:hypothetical protein
MRATPIGQTAHRDAGEDDGEIAHLFAFYAELGNLKCKNRARFQGNEHQLCMSRISSLTWA